jgi:tagatose 6-phosphate kinase
MIITVALNPAIDKVCLCEDFSLNSVNRLKEISATPGGKALNVARVINSLGHRVMIVGLIGGYTGQRIKNILQKENIASDFFEIDDESRICTTILDRKNNTYTQANEMGPFINQKDYDYFFDKYKTIIKTADIIVCSGSVPPGISKDVYGEMVDAANKIGKRVIIDARLHYLQKAIEKVPYMIKPNIHEIEELVKRKLSSIDDVVHEILKLMDSGIEMVVVSMEDKGAIIGNGYKIYQAVPPKVEVKNSVGSGDSMVAGFAAAINKNYNIEKTIALGVACGTANAMEFTIGKVNMDNLKKIYNNIEIKRLK